MRRSELGTMLINRAWHGYDIFMIPMGSGHTGSEALTLELQFLARYLPWRYARARRLSGACITCF